MQKLRLLLLLPVLFSLALTLRGADVLILVDDGHSSEPPVREMGAWLENVRPGKYSVDFSADVSPNVLDSSPSLSSDQIELLESYDLIIMPRHGPGASGDFDSKDWNDITTPMLIQNPFTVREGNWGWFPIGSEATPTENFTDLIVADQASPLFDGLEVSQGEAVRMTHLPEGHMQVEYPTDQITGEVLAWTPRFDNGDNLEYPWIVHWDGTEEAFYDGAPEAPAGPRMLFLDFIGSDKELYRNEGMQIWVNAVSMLTFGESDPGGLPENLAQEEPIAPASGADILLLTDVDDEDAAVHVDLADALSNYFPGSNVTRSAEFVTDDQPLGETQLADLAGYDLIVLPRAVSTGPYNTLTWNEVTTPILNLHPDYQRRTVEIADGDGEMTVGWSWFATSSGGTQEDLSGMTVRNWITSPEGVPHPIHPIYSGIDIPDDAEIQMYETPVDTRRANTAPYNPNRIYGDFLGSVAQEATRSFITLWRGGKPFGNWVDEDDNEQFLPTPAGARGQFLMPGGDGDVNALTETGRQLLLNTANWLIGEGAVQYHMVENFEQYPIPSGQSFVRLQNQEPNLWEVFNFGGDPRVIRGAHPGGERPNRKHAEMDHDGFYPTSIWHPLHAAPAADNGTATVELSFRVRLDDASLSGVNTNFALGPDTGEGDPEDNMRSGNPAAVRIFQDGTDNQIHYVGGDGVETALDGLHGDVWYEISLTLDMEEETFSLRAASLDESQSFTVTDVPFIESVDELNYFAIFSDDEDYQDLELSFDEIVVLSESVVADPVGFAEWQAEHFPDDLDDESISGPAADPDGDGIPNALEYVLGGDPNVPNRGIAPTTEVVEVDEESYLQLEFLRDPEASGVTLTVEQSLDLIDWTEVAGPESSDSENGMIREVWRADQPVGAEARGFLRLNVEVTD